MTNEQYYDNLYERAESVNENECPDCNGTGKELEVYSCCGDIVESADHDNCKTCGEHCGYVFEDCQSCNGEGVVI
jgi:DnaJ-class molecular chaperone